MCVFKRLKKRVLSAALLGKTAHDAETKEADAPQVEMEEDDDVAQGGCCGGRGFCWLYVCVCVCVKKKKKTQQGGGGGGGGAAAAASSSQGAKQSTSIPAQTVSNATLYVRDSAGKSYVFLCLFSLACFLKIFQSWPNQGNVFAIAFSLPCASS